MATENTQSNFIQVHVHIRRVWKNFALAKTRQVCSKSTRKGNTQVRKKKRRIERECGWILLENSHRT